MPAGTLLLQAAVGASLALVATLARSRLRQTTPASRVLLLFSGLTAAALTVALLVLVAKFLLGDVETFYVWRYSHQDHPWYYRLSGVWAGQAGTFLLWAWYSSLGMLALAWRGPSHQRHDGPSPYRIAIGVLAALTGILTLFSLSQGLFVSSSEYRLHQMSDGNMTMTDFVRAPNTPGVAPHEAVPEGFGLNPLLLTPFMVIHPWIEFAAYGMSGVLFALITAFLVTDDRRVLPRALAWARATWIIYTTAIALGALWAYYTLSFGGYWAWDPVETANLLPWLALTGYLHAGVLQKRHGTGDWFAPALAAVSFLLTLLSTFLVRSGVWNGSVHAFVTDGVLAVDDAGARLLAIMEREPHVGPLFALLAGSTLLTSLAFLHRARRHSTLQRRRRALALVMAGQATLLSWIVVSPIGLLATLIRASQSIWPDNYALPMTALVIGALGGPALYLFLAEPDGEPRVARQARVSTPRRLVSGAAMAFTLVTAVTLILLLQGINGTQRIVFDERAPLFALIFAALISAYFLGRAAGLRIATCALGASLVIGIGVALVYADQRPVALAAPTILLAFVATLLSLIRSAPRDTPRMAQLAYALVIVAGLAGLVMWTSPPQEVVLGGVRLQTAAWHIPVGIALSLGAIILAQLGLVGRSSRIFLGSSAAAALAYGYGASLALGATAAILIAAAHRRRAAPPPTQILRRLRTLLHRTSLHFLHFAVVVTMVGYGLSTYYAQDHAFTQEASLELGVPEQIGAYTISFDRTEGTDADGDGIYENVDAFLTVTRGGRLAGTAILSMYFVPSKDHYDPSTYVSRRPLEDVYFNANFRNAHAMYSEEDGWVVGHGPTEEVHSANITKLALNIRILPHVNVLWSGIFLGIASMATRMATRPPNTEGRVGPHLAEGLPEEAAGPSLNARREPLHQPPPRAEQEAAATDRTSRRS